MCRAVFSNWTVDEAKMLKKQESPFVVQSVEGLVPRIFLQLLSDFPNVILCYRPRRGNTFELVKQMGIFLQQFLKKSKK